MKIYNGARKGTNHDLLLYELGWPTLCNRRKGLKLKALINIINNKSPPYLQSLLPMKVGVNRPESRRGNNFQLLKARTEKFKNSFIPSSIRLWNSLSIENQSLFFCKELTQVNKNPLYYVGNRETNIKHAQLRLKCSKLNYHLHLLHVLEKPNCLCGNLQEDSNHYLLHCPLFINHRDILLHSVYSCTNSNVTYKVLLYGDPNLDRSINIKIFNAVHLYIESTERL